VAFIWTYKRNGTTYAEVRTSERKESGIHPTSVPVYLGKVIDMDKGLFQTQKLGVYKYSLDSGIDISDLPHTMMSSVVKEEKEILDFGASYLLAKFSKNHGLLDLYRNTLPKYGDTLLAMVFFYVETVAPNIMASIWLNGSVSHLLFPAAQLKSQRISEFLVTMGDESVYNDFFSRYLTGLLPENKKTGVLIDSTGLPNAIRFPLTAISNHNGEINEEVRLIYVVDTKSGMPLFFRYNPGNIVDITTLKATLAELAKNGVSVQHAILDAGYCSEENIEALYDAKIGFLTRLPVNRLLFQNAISKYREEVLTDFCRNMHNDRVVGIKRICSSIYGHEGYIYLCVDYNKRNDELKIFTKNALANKLPRNEWKVHTDKMGYFALISTMKLEPEEVLPLYYTRQNIEQIFDVAKNNLKILPLQVHSESTFRGHMLLTFMSIILYIKLNRYFSSHKKFTAQYAINLMRNLKCKVYNDSLQVKELTKEMKEICKLAEISIPAELSLPIKIL
jgi:hypothetical protein